MYIPPTSAIRHILTFFCANGGTDCHIKLYFREFPSSNNSLDNAWFRMEEKNKDSLESKVRSSCNNLSINWYFCLNSMSIYNQPIFYSTPKGRLGPRSVSAPSRIPKVIARQRHAEHQIGRPRQPLPCALRPQELPCKPTDVQCLLIDRCKASLYDCTWATYYADTVK